MELGELLRPEAVLSDLKATGKKQALHELAKRAAAMTGIGARRILDVLLERERLGSTGVGLGIAIPHARMAEVDRLWGLFARFETPVPFDAIDDRPVDLMFVLLAPDTAGADHLKALARISRLLRDKAQCSRLRGANGADALYAALIEPGASHDAA